MKKFMLSKSLAILFLFIFSQLSYSQIKLDNWKNYTSLASVNSVCSDANGKVWAGTTGGILVFDTKDSSITEIRNTEGLLSMKISCVKFDETDSSIYIGTTDGILHILDSKGKWHYVTDIKSAKYPNPEIKNIIFDGNYVFLSGGFGITKFDKINKVFIESVNRFGELKTNVNINDIKISSGFLFAASDIGLLRIPKSKSIADPDSWSVFSSECTYPESKILNLAIFNDTLFVTSETRICRFFADTLLLVQKSVDSVTISSLISFNGQLIYSTDYHTFNINNSSSGIFDHWQVIKGLEVIKTNSIEQLAFKYKTYCFSLSDGTNNTRIIPNSPVCNNFIDMDVDSKSRLWIATRPKEEKHADGFGFMMLDKNGKWTNFDNSYSSTINNWCIKINAQKDGYVYASSWGGGLVTAHENNGVFEFSKMDTSNSPFTGAITNALSFVIAGETAIDNNQNLWAVNYGEGNSGPLLINVDNSGKFHSYENTRSATEREFTELVIDQWGTKWLGSNDGAKGLYYFNENGTLDDLTDDISGKLIQSGAEDGLLDNQQSSLAVDKAGFIWIGTSSGLNFIYDTYSAISKDKIYVRQETHMRNQYIRDIYVDALNNKWIATNKGIWVLNEDASELLNKNIINSSNSPLIDDDVYSITSDPQTGIMYFGTKSGMSSAQSNSVLPAKSYSIKCYPQPFNPAKDKNLVIDGLEENSNVMILTIDGTLIKKLPAKGRIINWDGTDEFGNMVDNAVYIISASSPTTSGSSSGKCVVLRK